MIQSVVTTSAAPVTTPTSVEPVASTSAVLPQEPLPPIETFLLPPPVNYQSANSACVGGTTVLNQDDLEPMIILPPLPDMPIFWNDLLVSVSFKELDVKQ